MSRGRMIVLILVLIAGLAGGCASDKGGRRPEYRGFEKLGNQERTVEEWLQQAQEYMEKGKYFKAQQILILLEEEPLAEDRKIDIKLMVADAYYYQKGGYEVPQALARYEDFLTYHPYHPQAHYAQYMIGMCYWRMSRRPGRDQSKTREALRAFLQLRERYPNSSYLGQGAEMIRQCRDRLGEHEFQVGYFYWQWKKYGAAVRRFQLLAEQYPNFPRMDQVLYYMGHCLIKTNQRQEGEQVLRKLVEDFPQSKFAEKVPLSILKDVG